MLTHSSILSWRIPWTVEPSRLESMGLQRVGCDWALCTFIHGQLRPSRILQTPDTHWEFPFLQIPIASLLCFCHLLPFMTVRIHVFLLH